MSCIADVEKQTMSDEIVNTRFISVVADGATDVASLKMRLSLFGM